MNPPSVPALRPGSAWGAAVLVLLAVVSFQVAWLPHSAAGWAIVAFPLALLPLTRWPGLGTRFALGLAVGIGLYAPALGFFWTLFGPPAAVLWLILAFWPALFLAVAGEWQQRVPAPLLVFVLPTLWTGLEYFRSELYYLKFSWLTPGLALPPGFSAPLLHHVGGYGAGLVLFAWAAALLFLKGRSRWAIVLGLTLTACAPTWLPQSRTSPSPPPLSVAGAQVESAQPNDVPAILEAIATQHPTAELVVLPEYTLDAPPGEGIKAWCVKHRRHLIVGGRDPQPNGGFRNTAWVLDPQGKVIFSQVKSVPIQFFDDGEPASRQALWDSPWGRIGIAICYDLSYTRVIDRLARLGAQLLVIPTMDSVGWGENQHRLHARIAPARGAEYGIPIVRSASSGVSQLVDGRGRVTASAPFSEDVLIFGGTVQLGPQAQLPMDRRLAPACAGIAALLVGWAAWRPRPAPISP